MITEEEVVAAARLTLYGDDFLVNDEIDDFIDDDEPVTADAYHLLGKHNQKDHGFRGPRGPISQVKALEILDGIAAKYDVVDDDDFGIPGELPIGEFGNFKYTRFDEAFRYNRNDIAQKLQGPASYMQKIDLQKDRVISQQATVVRDHVEKHIRAGGMAAIPVIRSGDTYIVLDGNHRISASILLGEKFIDAFVYEAIPDPNEKDSVPYGGAYTGQADAFHLPGKHNQRDHGNEGRKKGLRKLKIPKLPGPRGGGRLDYTIGNDGPRPSWIERNLWPDILRIQEAHINETAESNKALPGYKNAVAGATKDLRAVADQPISVQMAEAGLDGLLHDGRFKTQHEVKPTFRQLFFTPSFYDPLVRGIYEERYLGVPKDTFAKSHPIYGYVGEPTKVINQFGKVRVELKPELRSSTTVSYGDSLNGMTRPVLIDNLKTESDERLLKAMAANDIWKRSRKPTHRPPYYEAQIHPGWDGLQLSDVQRIWLTPRMAKLYGPELKRHEIEVKIT